jgi:hypothetical protein
VLEKVLADDVGQDLCRHWRISLLERLTTLQVIPEHEVSLSVRQSHRDMGDVNRTTPDVRDCDQTATGVPDD